MNIRYQCRSTSSSRQPAASSCCQLQPMTYVPGVPAIWVSDFAPNERYITRDMRGTRHRDTVPRWEGRIRRTSILSFRDVISGQKKVGRTCTCETFLLPLPLSISVNYGVCRNGSIRCNVQKVWAEPRPDFFSNRTREKKRERERGRGWGEGMEKREVPGSCWNKIPGRIILYRVTWPNQTVSIYFHTLLIVSSPFCRCSAAFSVFCRSAFFSFHFKILQT